MTSSLNGGRGGRQAAMMDDDVDGPIEILGKEHDDNDDELDDDDDDDDDDEDENGDDDDDNDDDEHDNVVDVGWW